MGLLDTFARWTQPRSMEDPPLWSELSSSKKLSIGLQLFLTLISLLGILIFILDLSGL